MIVLMTSIASRKYPRIPLDQAATLDLQLGQGRTLSWTTMDVDVRTASCEGVGVKLRAPIQDIICRNRKSVLHFHAGNSPILIPGRIAWAALEPGQELDIGIRFDLALAKASSREIYSSWIVARILSLRDYAEQQR